MAFELWKDLDDIISLGGIINQYGNRRIGFLNIEIQKSYEKNGGSFFRSFFELRLAICLIQIPKGDFLCVFFPEIILINLVFPFLNVNDIKYTRLMANLIIYFNNNFCHIYFSDNPRQWQDFILDQFNIEMDKLRRDN